VAMSERTAHPLETVEGDCFYCGRTAILVNDHVVPLARGGPDHDWNVKAGCEPCNDNKSDLLPSEWCPTHVVAIEIEKRVPVIFPRMRHGHLLGGDRAESYATIRALCSNFYEAIAAEINSLPLGDKAIGRSITAQRAVEKLKIFINDRINIAEAKGEDEANRAEFRMQIRTHSIYNPRPTLTDDERKLRGFWRISHTWFTQPRQPRGAWQYEGLPF
jgi:hypothetical protein